jgi:biotin transport system substrate-specific component
VNAKDSVYSAMMAGLITVMALFPPIPLALSLTPVTLQSLGVMLAGSLLGAKRGFLALMLFLSLMIANFPVLSGLMGGAQQFFTVSGGFLISWPIAAYIIGWLTERFWNKLNFLVMFLINFIGGIGIVYIIGVPWMSYVAKISLLHGFYFSLSFLIGDIIKVLIATWIGLIFKRHYPLIHPRNHERLRAIPASSQSPVRDNS